jgi:tetrahydromethanopterin S-methyltransferase subunit A
MGEMASASGVVAELREGMALARCRQCGCMRDALLAMQATLAALGSQEAVALRADVDAWLGAMQPTKYACLGCDYCFAAAAGNRFAAAFPESSDALTLGCGFETKQGHWPVVPGEYLLVNNGTGPVAVSTLGSVDLPDELAALRPARWPPRCATNHLTARGWLRS